MRIVVVGGGLAGLFTASELQVRGHRDVVVVEEAPKPGGVARTIERDGFLLEPAVGSFSLPHPHLGPVLERADVETRPARDASMRYVYLDGRLIALPPSPRALLAPLLGIAAKMRALAEPLVAANSADDESLADFAKRRFGAKGGALVSWLMATGVFAGDPQRLSAGSSFPVLAALEREYGSVLAGVLRRRRRDSSQRERRRTHVPAGGMNTLIDSVAASLGDRCQTGFRVRSVARDGSQWVVEGPESVPADVVVLAVPPGVAASLLTGEMTGALNRGSVAPVAVIGLGGRGSGPLPPGFGALVGPGTDMSTRGILFESSYAPSRAPGGSWLAKVIVGGAGVGLIDDWDDGHLRSIAITETETVLGTGLAPDFVEVVKHRPGIPQYEVGHRDWLAEVDRLRRATPGLYLTGWGYRGVGVANLAADAAQLADEISSTGR